MPIKGLYTGCFPLYKLFWPLAQAGECFALDSLPLYAYPTGVRTRTAALLALLLGLTLPLSARNSVLAFGPDTGRALVITTPQQTDDRATRALEALADRLATSPPPIRVKIVITHNDLVSLPADLAPEKREGATEVIQDIDDEDSGAVVLVLPTDDPGLALVPGSRFRTAPRWLCAAALDALAANSFPQRLEEYRLQLYRLGWVAERPLLAEYLRSDIPAIALVGAADPTDVLETLVRSPAIADTWDQHFIAFRAGERVVFVGERASALAVIVASAAILLFLFVFGFLFGKRSEERFRDFLRVWWLPFLYAAVTLVALVAGGRLVRVLVSFRFSFAESWRLFPLLTLLAKFSLAWFFINLLVSVNRLIVLPKDDFIYGYIASVAALFNVFAFASLDFSLAFPFLAAYALAFALYHARSLPAQTVGVLVFLVPFVPYALALTRAGAEPIGPLLTGESGWNLRLALFALPIQLMASRVQARLGRLGHPGAPTGAFAPGKIRVPLDLVVSFLVATAFAAAVLFVPALSSARPLEVEIRQRIDDAGSSFETRSLMPLARFDVVSDPSMASAPDSAARASEFVTVTTRARAHLGRLLVGVSVSPLVPAELVEVTVSRDAGFAVYDASIPFDRVESGETCVFTSGVRPEGTFSFEFSSDADARLSVTARVWSRLNPWGITLRGTSVRPSFLLEVIDVSTVGEAGD